MSKYYLIVDPCNSDASGITTYSRLVKSSLEKLGVRSEIFVRINGESVSKFRSRLGEYVKANSSSLLMIETPESYAAVIKLNTNVPIHIRLHSSKTVLRKMIGKRAKLFDRINERRSFSKADVVSAPSTSIAEISREYFDTPIVSIYPNPMAKFEPRVVAKEIDVLFFGRFIEIKGTNFLKEIIEKIPHVKKIVLAGKGASKYTYLKAYHPNVLVMEDIVDKKSLISSAKVVMIPSVYESFSMVAAECLSLGVPCVMWDKSGILEYVSENLIRPAKSYDIDSFVAAIETTLADRNTSVKDYHYAHQYMSDYFVMGLVSVINKYTDLKIILQRKPDFYYISSEQVSERSDQL